MPNDAGITSYRISKNCASNFATRFYQRPKRFKLTSCYDCWKDALVSVATRSLKSMPHTKLTSGQITGFWGAWSGWTLDGMDSFIYALAMSPALSELLPRSGIEKTPENIGLAGSILFALFLIGWGISFIWGPIADRFGRTRVLAATIFAYAIFTGAAALATSVWQLGLFRLLAGKALVGSGRWPAPTLRKLGLKIGEKWARDIYRPAIILGFSSLLP